LTNWVRIAQGERGEAVRDLQHRLVALGHELAAAEAGVFGEATEAAVRAFQADRGLRVDGICGRETWSALVEAGYSLGDRLLYHRTPMLRGDDVADLQRRLNALGFDAGKEDGIFGPRTAAGMLEFQRNVGLAGDGICGPASVDALDRLSRFAGGSVAALREREALRTAPKQLAGRRVYLAVEPGLDALGELVGKGLLDAGAEMLLDAGGDDDSAVAGEANRYVADLFFGLRFGDIAGCACDFFAARDFRSESGYRVAAAVLAELAAVLGSPASEPTGRAYAVLRETRMPAVVCQPVRADDVEGVRRLVGRSGDTARAIVRGIRRAIEEPFED
jgi:N-acetylmuramoyl-L-alanine amidase